LTLLRKSSFIIFLGELNHEHGLTIVFVSHDIDIVANEVHSLFAFEPEDRELWRGQGPDQQALS